MNRQVLVSLAVCLGIAAPAAPQSAMTKGEAPITAAAKPSIVIGGGNVTISGTTASLGKGGVTIAIAAPGGKSAALTASVLNDGSFSTKYKAEATPGSYTATITAPDGKGKTTVTFRVVNSSGMGVEVGAKMTGFSASLSKASSRLGEMQAALPASPAKDEAQKKLDALNKKLAEVQKANTDYQQGVKGFTDYLNANPNVVAAGLEGQSAGAAAGLGGQFAGGADVPTEPDPSKPVVQDLMDGLQADVAAEEEHSKEIDDAIAHSKKEGLQCDVLDSAIELTNAISLGLNFNRNVLKFFKNMVNDKRWGLAINKAASPGASDDVKFHAQEAIKTAVPIALLGGVGVLDAVIGLANDYAGWYLGNQFSKYCEKFEGPFTGHFVVELRADNKNPWLRYSYDYEGKISLRFAKQDPNHPTAAAQSASLSGQIEGNARNFKGVDDALQLDQSGGKLRRNLIFHQVFTPKGSPYLEELGLAGRALTPGYFNVPLKGEIVKDKLTFRTQAATFDFLPTVVFQVVVVFQDFVTGLPMVEKANMPAQNGYFFASRVLHDHPGSDIKDDPATFTIKTEGNQSVAQRQFTRHYNDDTAGITVDWLLDAKMCNPGCLSTDSVTGLQKHN